MNKLNYVVDSAMEEMYQLSQIGIFSGSIELFLEHECSEPCPGVIHYLTSSQHEDQNDGGYDAQADDDQCNDEGHDGVHDERSEEADDEKEDEEDEEGDDDNEDEMAREDDADNDDERPREDDEGEQSEDENPEEEQVQNEGTDQIDDDDGDDVVLDEGDGASDERFKSLFKEGEECNNLSKEDNEEKQQEAREAAESDEDYEGYMKGDAVYPDTPVPSEEEWEDWTDKKRFKGKGKTKFHGDMEKEPYIWLFQKFNSGLEFKDQLLRYVLNTQFDIKMAKSEKSRITVICCNKECK